MSIHDHQDSTFVFTQEIFFFSVECQTESLLNALARPISDVFIPFTEKFSTQEPIANGKNIFLRQLEQFLAALENAQRCVDDRIFLKNAEQIDFNQISSLQDFIPIATNSEKFSTFENTMKIWIQQLEQVQNAFSFVDFQSKMFFCLLASR